MATFIAIIILLACLLGMGLLAFRKIPLLLELPEVLETPEKEKLTFRLRKKIQEMDFFRDFSYEIFLQKILSKIRILTLKTDNKASLWLQKLREKSKKKKINENDNYWEEIRKSTNSRKIKRKNSSR